MADQGTIFGASGRTDDDATLAELEVDYTPVGIAVQIVDQVMRRLPPASTRRPLRVLCPAAGSGVFARAARAVIPGCSVFWVEPRESEAAGLELAADEGIVGRFDPGKLAEYVGPFDLVIDNPPFSWFASAMWCDIREAGLLTDRGVIAFVGLSQWGQGRASRDVLARWWPSLQLRVTGRPAFRGDGKTDAREISAWCWRSRSIWEDGGGAGEWRTVQMPPLPPGLLRWDATAVPGTFEIDATLVEEVRRC